MATALQSAHALADDLERIFGRRLRAVLVYGTHARPHQRAVKATIQTMALVDTLAYADLSACADTAGRWQARGLDVPLLMPLGEFARALDAFPLEYGDIIAHHIIVRGDTPFAGMAVTTDDVRRACEVRARSHVLHLREGFLLAEQRPRAIADLIVASAGPLASLLETFSRMTGAPAQATPDAIAAHVARETGQSASLVERLLALEEDDTLDASEAQHLYPPYLDLVLALVAAIDAWAPQGRA